MRIYLNAWIAMGIVISSLVGCSMFGYRSVEYLGGTNELADVATPAGFTVTPSEAKEIYYRQHNMLIFADNFYHDDENYYVDRYAPLKNSASTAVKYGTIIHGQTGKIFNRETETWEDVPER
jgi:hypothetical protein